MATTPLASTVAHPPTVHGGTTSVSGHGSLRTPQRHVLPYLCAPCPLTSVSRRFVVSASPRGFSEGTRVSSTALAIPGEAGAHEAYGEAIQGEGMSGGEGASRSGLALLSPVILDRDLGGSGLRNQRKPALRFVMAWKDKRRRVSVKKWLPLAWSSHGWRETEKPRRGRRPSRCASMKKLLHATLADQVVKTRKRDRPRKVLPEVVQPGCSRESTKEMRSALSELIVADTLVNLRSLMGLSSEILCSFILCELRRGSR